MSYATFESEIAIRPDDIDVNGHLHNSKYLDLILAARYDQMGRCYGVSMDEFLKLGYSWVNTKSYIEYKRELFLGDVALVRTRIGEMYGRGCRVEFEVLSKTTGKLSATGWQDYIMISIETKRPATIPDWIAEKYSV